MRSEKKAVQCDSCCQQLAGASRRARSNGKHLCGKCWNYAKEYLDHWFVRSLRFEKPAVKARRGLKPLPGQRELFDNTGVAE